MNKNAKTVSLGVYVPVRGINDFSIPLLNGLTFNQSESINVQSVAVRDIDLINIEKPGIDIKVTTADFDVEPLEVNEKDVRLITSLEAPQVPLNDVKVFNLKLDTQSNPLVTINSGSGIQTTSGVTLNSASANDIGVLVTNNKNLVVTGNSNVER